MIGHVLLFMVEHNGHLSDDGAEAGDKIAANVGLMLGTENTHLDVTMILYSRV